MRDEDKTKEQLIDELVELRQRNTGLGVSESERKLIKVELQKHRNSFEELVLKRSDELTGTIEQLQNEITERKRMEQALLESEHFARTIISSLGEGVIVYDHELRYKMWSKFMEDLAGLPAKQVIGKFALDLFPHLREQGVDVLLQQALAGETVRSTDTPYRVPMTGKSGWVISIYSPHRTADGEIVGVVATVHDITKQKRAAEELRHRLEFEKLIAGISTDFMSLATDKIGDDINQVLRTIGEFFDAEHSFAFMFYQGGTKIERIYEWYAEDVERQMSDLKGHIFDVELPWLAERMEQAEVVNVSCIADLPTEACIEREHFQERGVRSFIEVPMIYSGSLIGVLGFESIQTERTWSDNVAALLRIVGGILANALGRWRAELTLRDSELKYRVLVENTNEAIIVIQDGMIKFLNPRTVELTGYSETELTSRPFQDFVHPDDQEMLLNRYSGVLKGEGPSHVPPFRITHREGGIRWGEGSTVVITWEGRPNSAILHFLSDITERKRMEEELLKTEKLESLGVLAGGIAHDFNNILTAILGNISLAGMYLESGTTSGKATEILREAERASMRAKELTQQLLTFSKGGAPVKELATIGQIVKDAATFASRGSSTVCEFSIPDDLRPVEIDRGQIDQVINNLIINACQAMPAGGVIKLQAQNISITAVDALPLKDGEYIKLSVADQGVGMPEAIIQKIFDPFFTTKQAGNGLGLATSYSIIQKHNGYLTVESEMGVGTIFHIYLPASIDEIPVTEKREEAAPVMGEGRILVMDDERNIRDLTVAVLSKLGYRVSTSVDGAEAIQLYQEAENSGQPYDAVIMDLTIPGGMGGKETVERLMEIDPNVKAIVSSGYSTDPIMSNFREHGFQGVIVKPYKIMDLSAVLHRVASE
ncbi:PAS domain S-box protein [Candidatus Poribacteria bacterium]